ncbi:hypothetical protein [Streptomyces sp. NBC_01614]
MTSEGMSPGGRAVDVRGRDDERAVALAGTQQLPRSEWLNMVARMPDL